LLRFFIALNLSQWYFTFNFDIMNKLFVLLLMVCSCSDAAKKTTINTSEKAEQVSFFPVTSYIKGQIAELKTSKVKPIIINIAGDKSDSTFLKIEDLDAAFKEYINPEIDSTNLIDLFTETRFEDKTINAFTFIYTAKPEISDNISLIRWDVIIDPETNTVKRIYIVKKIDGNKELQLTWQSGKYCKAVTIATDNTGKQFLENEQTIKWNFE